MPEIRNHTVSIAVFNRIRSGSQTAILTHSRIQLGELGIMCVELPKNRRPVLVKRIVQTFHEDVTDDEIAALGFRTRAAFEMATPTLRPLDIVNVVVFER